MNKQELSEAMRELKKQYAQKLTDYAHEHFGSDYEVPDDMMNNSNLQIGFYKGTYRSGEPMFHGLDMYFGSDNLRDIEWKCEMNVSAMGAFNINGNSREAKYYRLVGKVMNDDGGFEKIIREFYDNNWQMEKLMHRIWRAEERVKREEEHKKLEAEKKAFVEKVKNAKFGQFVVISKDQYSGRKWFTYRKKPVSVYKEMIFDDEYDARLYCGRNFVNMSYNKIIEISKLKIA